MRMWIRECLQFDFNRRSNKELLLLSSEQYANFSKLHATNSYTNPNPIELIFPLRKSKGNVLKILFFENTALCTSFVRRLCSVFSKVKAHNEY